MSRPYEILATPIEVWLAPVGTAFPTLDEEPDELSPSDSDEVWTLLGANGADNQGDEGVTVESQQTINVFRGGKSTAPLKAWRTEEGLRIAFTLFDVTLEAYAKAINDATVTDTAADSGTAGYRSMNLHQGSQVATFALLARGENSPYGDGWLKQYQVPVVYQAANPAPVYRKGQPAGLAFEFMALADLDAATEDERFGQLIQQDAAAL